MAKRKGTDNTIAKRKGREYNSQKKREIIQYLKEKGDNTIAKRKGTDNTIAKRKGTNTQTMIYNIFRRMLKI